MRRVVPVYLVVNTSRTMVSRLDEVSHLLAHLKDLLLYSPLLADRVRVCLVTFADTAQVVLPLGDLTEVDEVPRLSIGRETRFRPVFDLLARLIDIDSASHMAAGAHFERPELFLITDGAPADRDWEKGYDRLYRRAHSTVSPFLVGVDQDQAALMGVALRTSRVHVINDDDEAWSRTVLTALRERLEPMVTSRIINTEDLP